MGKAIPDSYQPVAYSQVVACRVHHLFCVRCLNYSTLIHCGLTSISIMAQVYVVVAAGSVIAFIIRDIGDPAIAGWIIQVNAMYPACREAV